MIIFSRVKMKSAKRTSLTVIKLLVIILLWCEDDVIWSYKC